MGAGMRIVIVGASGNMGTALLRRLADEPAVTAVTGLARRPPAATEAPYAGVDWVPCDLSVESSAAVLRGCFTGADVVVHLAWEIQGSHDQPRQWRTNVDGSGRVFAAARDAGVAHLVYASSVGAYAPDESAGDGAVRRPESWPVTGVPTAPYSRQKAAVEAMLDETEARGDMVVSRLRPGLIFQGGAGSQIARYFLGPLVPTSLLRVLRLPVVPLPRGLQMQAVHADDAADAYARVIVRRAAGAFNIAAEPIIDTAVLAGALGGRPLPVDPRVFRVAAAATFQARLQPTEPGWLDLAMSCPLLATDRARHVLDWQPQISATAALDELVAGMGRGAGTQSSAMRPREPAAGRISKVRSALGGRRSRR